jgi:hypothetical protein
MMSCLLPRYLYTDRDDPSGPVSGMAQCGTHCERCSSITQYHTTGYRPDPAPPSQSLFGPDAGSWPIPIDKPDHSSNDAPRRGEAASYRDVGLCASPFDGLRGCPEIAGPSDAPIHHAPLFNGRGVLLVAVGRCARSLRWYDRAAESARARGRVNAIMVSLRAVQVF